MKDYLVDGNPNGLFLEEWQQKLQINIIKYLFKYLQDENYREKFSKDLNYIIMIFNSIYTDANLDYVITQDNPFWTTVHQSTTTRVRENLDDSDAFSHLLQFKVDKYSSESKQNFSYKPLSVNCTGNEENIVTFETNSIATHLFEANPCPGNEYTIVQMKTND
uniref:Uncharacterized protein n=1 Tax=Meloidogyne hapla TaxID=6305 RepID=A0A1I8BRZ8_MELHA